MCLDLLPHLHMVSLNVLGGPITMGGVLLYSESRAKCSYSVLLWYLHLHLHSWYLLSLLGKAYPM